MKYQAQIIGVVALCCVLGAMGAAWQFYFKETFEQYRADDAMREALERSLKQLEETFQGYKPDLLINEWQNKLQPWRNAREERAVYFNFGDWFEIDIVPDETRMLKFWYNEELDKMTMALYRMIYEKMGGYDRFPQDIPGLFNIQREDVTNMEQVRINLAYMSFATSVTEFLLNANVTHVESIVNWPRRIPSLFSQLLALQTVGLSFTMPARDLARMLDDLRQQPRYFTVEGIKITYPYIAYAAEPQLNVSLLLTQANYRKPPEEPEGAAAAGAPGRGMAPARPIVARPKEPGAFSKAWTWFKRNVLYMN